MIQPTSYVTINYKLQLAITVTYYVNQMRFPHIPDLLEKLSVKEAE